MICRVQEISLFSRSLKSGEIRKRAKNNLVRSRPSLICAYRVHINVLTYVIGRGRIRERGFRRYSSFLLYVNIRSASRRKGETQTRALGREHQEVLGLNGYEGGAHARSISSTRARTKLNDPSSLRRLFLNRHLLQLGVLKFVKSVADKKVN